MKKQTVEDLRKAVVFAAGVTPFHVALVGNLIDAVRKEAHKEFLEDTRGCCNAKCRNKDVPCLGQMELHWVCETCGHEHHATKPED